MRPGFRKDSLDNVQKSPYVNIGKGAVTTARPRAATFVQDENLSHKAVVMSGTANVVTRLKQKSGQSLIVGTDRTVFFKAHDDEVAASQYAVASTRMARFIGMPKIIAHNAFARVKGVKGVVAGRVPGVPMMTSEYNQEVPAPQGLDDSDLADWVAGAQVVERKGKYYTRSAVVVPPVDFANPVVQKGMSDLQLFDALTGQLDRHGGNIYVDPKTGAITGIDDDASFGKGQPADDVAGQHMKDKYAGLPALVDESTAESILRADPRQLPAELAGRVNDTRELTDEEIADAQRRLVAVQAYLQGLKDRGELVTDWGDATYQDAMQHPDRSYLGRQARTLSAARADAQAGQPGASGFKIAKGATIPPPKKSTKKPTRTVPATGTQVPTSAPITVHPGPPPPPVPPGLTLEPLRRRAMAVTQMPAQGRAVVPPQPRSILGAARARLVAGGANAVPGIGEQIEPTGRDVVTLTGDGGGDIELLTETTPRVEVGDEIVTIDDV